MQNWARNITFEAKRVHRPATVEETRAIVLGAQKVRTLGSRHSFNRIADTPEDLISTEAMTRIVGLDEARSQVTIEGGVRYGELGRYLDERGYALHNFASLPHISVAGGAATATHGSGIHNGNLATPIAAIEFVRADGELIRLSRDEDPETFPGAVVNLGGLGPVVRLTLDVEPAFRVAQTVYEALPLDLARANFEEIESKGYSVSMFTHWAGEKGQGQIDQLWIKRRMDDGGTFPDEVFGARKADGPRHPIAGMAQENCTPQMGEPGPWDDRLPHFRYKFTPSSGEELQSEYILPRAHAADALGALDEIRDLIAPLLLISEIRTVAADGLWMSPSYGVACVCIHFTWHPKWEEVREVLPRIEAALAPFGAKPHWGKLFTMAPDRVRSLFERANDFDALLRTHDPKGKFRNEFLTEILGAV